VVYYEWTSRDNVTYRITDDIRECCSLQKFQASGIGPTIFIVTFYLTFFLEMSIRSWQLMNIPVLVNKILNVLPD